MDLPEESVDVVAVATTVVTVTRMSVKVLDAEINPLPPLPLSEFNFSITLIR